MGGQVGCGREVTAELQVTVGGAPRRDGRVNGWVGDAAGRTHQVCEELHGVDSPHGQWAPHGCPFDCGERISDHV